MNTRQLGVPHAKGTKEGGTSDPEKYAEFGNWLADCVVSTSNSQMAQLWKTIKTGYAVLANKPLRMTETPGDTDSWQGSNTNPTLDLGLAIRPHCIMEMPQPRSGGRVVMPVRSMKIA